MIPALEWHLFFETFEKFAAMAREYHFYDKEIANMEASLMEMSPIAIKSKERSHEHERGYT